MLKGISPIISYVLIVGIVLTATMIAYTWALPLSEQLSEKGKVSNYKNQMIGLDYAIRSAAHGDINFQNEYEFYLQDATILLDETQDVIYLTFTQEANILGVPNATGTLNCTYSTEFLYDPSTKLTLYRESDLTRVYQGSAGAVGTAEFAICYYNVDLQWGGDCIRGRSGQKTLIEIKKVNVTNTAGTYKPVVTVDVC